MDTTTENEFLAYALAYAELGFPVFPCIPALKIPYKGTRGCLDATTDAAQIQTWWTKQPRANVAIATGHNCFALDVDIRHNGEETLESLTRKHGPLPDTIQQITPTGGRHYLFAMPGFEFQGRAGFIGQTETPGLDIRGPGNYIMAAPSIHPDTRTRYEWDGMSEFRGEICIAPAWLLDMLRGTPSERRQAQIISARVPHGQQHSALVSYAGSMRNRGGTADEIYAALMIANATRCEQPGSERNIRRIADSMMKYSPGSAPLTPGNAIPEYIEGEECTALEPVGNPEWRNNLQITTNGAYRPNLANTMTTLLSSPDWAGRLAFDEFAQGIRATVALPSGIPENTVLKDHHYSECTAYLQHEYGIQITTNVFCEAANSVARKRSIHPVREYLNGLEWDGTERLSHWLEDYLGCDTTAYTRAVARRWMISAVARVMEPGCKADCMLILEGPQGLRKSSCLAVLGGAWFTDELSDLGNKDAAIQIAGVWIVEIAELDGFGRAETTRIKAFASRTSDRYRPPYGRNAVDVPRQCIFAGTTNTEAYLKDETGGRRFWPVKCAGVTADGKADVPGLEAVRDQLWAEALAAYQSGELWYLETNELVAAAEQEQADRYDSDPWEAAVDRYAGTREDVTVEEILLGEWAGSNLTAGVGKRLDQITQQDKTRVSRCLKSLGYEKRRTKSGRREWRYFLPEKC